MTKSAAMPQSADTSTESGKRAMYLSHFTPSMMSPQTLEAMFVQREPLLTRTVDHVVESVRNGGLHHSLFVGPRGIGKTHLVSLLHHRLAQHPEIQQKALIAWMREEEWGVTSFFELVLRILRTVAAGYPELDLETQTKPIYDLPIEQAAQQAQTVLAELLSRKMLVVLLENLDDLFEQLGKRGQTELRAFIQNHPNMVLIGTTPALFAGVTSQALPFYGFFDVEQLNDLSFDDVMTLLGKLAAERGDADLVAYLKTPEGRSRVRAVHHLAEGNPRLYIIFSQFLTREALDELVQSFMHTLDELTPYYQARMKELPGQQRKIVEYLVRYRGAAPVKQIAKACFITQQVCSSQLKQLKDKRFVRAVEQGRESYYELTEPLMRLCMEVKQQRGEPLSLFVELLRIWYRQEELEQLLTNGPPQDFLPMAYVEKALQASKDEGDIVLNTHLKALGKALGTNNTATAISYFDDLVGIKPNDEVAETELWEVFALVFAAHAGHQGLNSLPTVSEADCQRLARSFVQITREKFVSERRDVDHVLVWVTYVLYVMNPTTLEITSGWLNELIEVRPVSAAAAALWVGARDVDSSRWSDWFKLAFAPSHLRDSSKDFLLGLKAMLDTLTTGDTKELIKLPAEYRKLFRQLFKNQLQKKRSIVTGSQ